MSRLPHAFQVAWVLMFSIALAAPFDSHAQQKAQARDGGVAININGNNNRVIVNQSDPKVLEILRRLDKRSAQEDSLRTENAKLRQQLAEAIAAQVSRASSSNSTSADKQAVTALEAGDTRPTEELLAQREEAAQRDPKDIKARREAADLARQQGALAFGRDSKAALAAYQRAISYEPDDLWSMYHIGDLELIQGRTSAALSAYHKGREIAQKLAASDPSKAEWQRDLSVSYNKIGDIQLAQGDLDGALKSFQASMAILQKLAVSDPSNAKAQRELSFRYNKIGDTQNVQGNLGGALESFQAGMAITRKLAASDPGNSLLQHDLNASYDRIGDMQRAQGNLDGALKSFQAFMTIARKLVASDPGNGEWQRDLSVSYNKIGETQSAQGNLGGALKSFQAGMAIRQKLAASDPHNAQWQRDLSMSYQEIGDTQQALGDQGSALKSFRASMAIRQKLAASDPKNADWQRDVWILLWRLTSFPVSGVTWTHVVAAMEDMANRKVLLPMDQKYLEQARENAKAVNKP